MRDVWKYALRLMLFAAAAGLLLSVVNAVTEEPIAQQLAAKVNAAREEVIGRHEFEAIDADLSAYPAIESVYTAKSGEDVVGYVYELKGKGYGGNISLSMGVNTAGAVTGVSVSNHKETKGLGTSAEKRFITSFYGMAASPEDALAMDGITGATISSTAVRNAISQACAFSEDELGIPGKADPFLAYTETSDADAVTLKAISRMLPGTVCQKLDPLSEYRTLNDLYFAKEPSGETLYVYRATATAESGRTILLIALEEDGTVRSIAVESYDENIIYLIGSMQRYIASVEGVRDVSAVDAVSGATESCDAIAGNVREAQAHLAAYLAEGGGAK